MIIFGMLNPKKIRHERFTYMSTSPARCSHFTLGNPKKSHFQQYYSYISDYSRYLRRKQIATVALQLSCLLTVV